MTDSRGDAVSAATGPTDRLIPAAFAGAVFTSASLLFVVQPMATKLILPTLGGSPSVWNTAMVFFQAALLVGYAYAHLLQRLSSLKLQVAVHLGLLLLAGLFLPLHISAVFGDPPPGAPIAWLLGTMAVSIGAPFAVLSATAPLLQAWYARVQGDGPEARNPYVLYAASNLGSFLALLAYPVLIEPLATLSGQRAGWTGGYVLFLVVIASLAVLVWRRRIDRVEAPPLARTAPLTWPERGILVLLAAAPSSLMLGVTAHLSTDVASAPFLWVVPLALYLLTFVIAFQDRPWIPVWLTLVLAAAVGVTCCALTALRPDNWLMLVGLQLSAFFLLTLMCHQVLASRRPPPDRLTEFYLLMSLGGVVGGAFTALLAPVIFNNVWEYPLVLVLVGLARPWNREGVQKWEIYTFVVALLFCAAPSLLAAVFDADWDLAWKASNANLRMETLTLFILLVPMIGAFLIRDRMPAYVILLAAITASAWSVALREEAPFTDRSFFGVMRVTNQPDVRMGGDVHVLAHGTTLHGAQARDPQHACAPTLYYAPTTPIGQAAQRTEARLPAAKIGVVGQGSGAMAAYKRASDQFTFFEIDPMVDQLSRDPQWFTYISGCARGPIRTVLGDARLTLAHETPGSYDLLIIDAFSSDAVPTHLLTVEAIQGYLRLLKPDGVVLLHLSNRNLEITLPAFEAARTLGVPSLHQIYVESDQSPTMAEASTEALILSPTEAGLAEYRQDGRWRQLAPSKVRPWTDDYVNLFGSLYRHLAHGW